MPTRLLIPLATAALAALALAAPAVAAPPLPFGHACTPQDGTLFCPTASDAQRVASFDGTPIDVDVTLPAQGDGPFPTLLMLHGYGQDKTAFEPHPGADPDYSSAFYAQHGYAVVTPSFRGFGRSCGKPDSRTPDCAHGYIHTADTRFEARDFQTLLGILVDEGIANPNALGTTGVSYGGGTSLELAYMRDRIRLPDGSFAPWTSPNGTPLHIAAAWPRWPWSDLADSLVPNGRLLAPHTPLYAYRAPVGVPIIQYGLGLYSLALSSGFVAPQGSEQSADLTGWVNVLNGGEPYGAKALAILDEMHNYHGASGVPLEHSGAAPLIIQSGWTDDLFPVGQGLRAYDQLRRADPSAPVWMQVGDLGHSRAANHPGDTAVFDAQGLAFFERELKGAGTLPAPGTVTAFTQTCPRTARNGGGPYRGPYASLARGVLRFGASRRQRVTSTGGNAKFANSISPFLIDPCKALRAPVEPGTAVVTARSRGFTLLGRTTIRGRAAIHGSSPELAARLWDLNPRTGTQRLVDRGILRVARQGAFAFRLDGNGWRFARGHTVKLELLGRDGPTYRPSSTKFTLEISKLRIELPTRERRP
ncbi:MAG TPA: CocE/NonD family hydrolase [Solirubrobacteraceae bacterium]|nr:CocE/NonD family hydrolase [Solirubrobacteraceae bacterium]